MTDEEIAAVAAKVVEKLQPPAMDKPAAFEIASHGVIDGKFVVMVKAPSEKYYVTVASWIEVPNPKV